MRQEHSDDQGGERDNEPGDESGDGITGAETATVTPVEVERKVERKVECEVEVKVMTATVTPVEVEVEVEVVTATDFAVPTTGADNLDDITEQLVNDLSMVSIDPSDNTGEYKCPPYIDTNHTYFPRSCR
jgi:hypothetical protein